MRINARRGARRAVAGLVAAVLLAGGAAPAMAEALEDAPLAEPTAVVAPGEGGGQAVEEQAPDEQAPDETSAEQAPPAVEQPVEQPTVQPPDGEGAERRAAEAAGPLAADPPRADLAQAELSVSKALALNEGAGLVIGVGPHPEPGEHRVLLDDQESGRGVPDPVTGELAWTAVPAQPGSYTIRVEAPSGERSTPSVLTVVGDPVVSAPEFVNDRIVRYGGYRIEASGFAPGEAVTLTGPGGTTDTANADGAGVLRYDYGPHAGAPPLGAAPTLVLESPTRRVVHEVERRDPVVDVPQEMTVTEASLGSRVLAENLPEDFVVELEIDGRTVDSSIVEDGFVELWLPQDLGPGTYAVRVVDDAGELSASQLRVIDDAETRPVTNIEGRWLDRATHAEHGFTLRVERVEPFAAGLLAIVDADQELVGMTEVQADGDGVVELPLPLEFFDELEAGEYTLAGMFIGDLVALRAAPAAAGPQFLRADFVLTDLTVQLPATVTQQQLDAGVDVTGTGFQPGEPVTIVVGELIAGTVPAEADTSAELSLPIGMAAGEWEVFLVSEAGYVRTTTTVLDEPVVPGAGESPGPEAAEPAPGATAATPAAVRGRLPATGADAVGGLLASALVLVAGGAAVLSRQRRRA